MSILIQQSGNYAVKKDDVIFLESQNLNSLNILLKGKIDVYLSSLDVKNENNKFNEEDILLNSFRIFSVDQNIFIGTIDLFLKGNYSFSYKAVQDSILYAYPIVDMSSFSDLMNTQKDYGSHTITSISTMMLHSYEALEKLESWMRKLVIFSDNLSLYFWLIKDKYNLTYTPNSLYLADAQEKYQHLKELGLIPLQYASPYLDQELIVDASLEYSYLDQSIMDTIEYYKHIINLPLQLRKDFFSADDYIANHHFNEAAQNFDSIKYNMKEAIGICQTYFNRIYHKTEKCIYADFVSLIEEVKKYDQNSDELIMIFDDLTNKIVKITKAFQQEYSSSFDVDIPKLLIFNRLIKTSPESKNTESTETLEVLHDIPEELIDSAEKIIRYSEIPNDEADILRNCLSVFRKLEYKLTTDSEMRDLINTTTPIFFQIYERVFKKAMSENKISRMLEMFLNYGYMDETLLTTDQVITLYTLSDNSNTDNYCSVFNMREWLTEIHNMKKDPSINEFDQDYFDVFREMKKKNEVSDKDKARYDQDINGRLSFEINNMFKTNHKLIYGQPNTYFPILHSDMITRDFSKSLVTKEAVNEIVQKILSVDFTAFYREILYQNRKTGVEKEIIFKTVAPEIILLPTFGCRSIMWQVITGRVRSTPGRFILPIFTSENLEDMLIQLVGNFRWELCKTMMGVSWNDISEKSLTSEYMDYIQFYRKNKDLSEDAREKIRAQILRYNSKMKDIFTADYEIWIKHESKGSIRLNKIARSLLFKYCPFEKSIRDRLEKQPIFSEYAIQFNTSRSKQAKDLENRYNRLLGNDITKDEVLLENLKFFKDL